MPIKRKYGVLNKYIGVPGVIGAGGDTTAPLPTITADEGTWYEAKTVTITFTNGAGGATEAVTGFTVEDLTLGNCTAADFTEVSDGVYTATITPTASGAVTVDIAAEVCTDAASNNNAAATQLARTYWNPLSLGATVRWLDPTTGLFQDAEQTTPAGNGEVVGGWADRGSNGTDASGATTQRPTLNTGLFGTGMPGLTFDGTANLLTWNGLAAVMSGSDTPWSACMAIKLGRTNVLQVFLGAGNTAATRPIHYVGNDATAKWETNRDQDPTAGNDHVWDGGTADTNTHVLTFVFDGTNCIYRIDGVQVASGDQNLVELTFNTFTLMGFIRNTTGSWTQGSIGDVIFVPSELSEANIANCEAFVAPRCGLSYPFDALVIAGQSNASGRGTNNQTYSHATKTAYVFDNAYALRALTDPYDSATGQVDTVSSDTSPAAAGSFVPLLATSIMATTNQPVIFVPTAKGGTSITSWLPGADHFDRTTLYGSMAYRAQISGARVVLWWQGETDAEASMTQATYNGHLDTLANAIQDDPGIKLMACKLQNCSGADVTAINAAIAEAWADNANVLTGPDLSDLETDDTFHLKTDAKLQTVADRWWTALQATDLY